MNTPFPNIKKIVANKDWKLLIKSSLPINIVDLYSFNEAMQVANFLVNTSTEEMMEEGFTADLMRDYAVNLMMILRAQYSQEWKQDWKNEAFLGIVCALVFRDAEAFKFIQNAYQQLNEPPQSLILAYISAGSGPDHFLTKNEIEKLSQKAIERGVTCETAHRMAALAQEQNDQKGYEYWTQKANEAEKNGVHTSLIVPNVIKDSFKDDRYRYEK